MLVLILRSTIGLAEKKKRVSSVTHHAVFGCRELRWGSGCSGARATRSTAIAPGAPARATSSPWRSLRSSISGRSRTPMGGSGLVVLRSIPIVQCCLPKSSELANNFSSWHAWQTGLPSGRVPPVPVRVDA
jgi:hypothetical protein